MRITYWIIAGCFFTASFDLILLLDVGGVVRISQLFLGLLCILALVRIIQDGRILWPRGSTPLLLWVLFQLAFIPLSGAISIGIQFFVLLAFTVVGFFAVVQLYGRSTWLEPLMRLYLLSYAFIGFFGLLQFVLPLFGLPSILTQQWLLHGKFARVNGFSYEPSYYATYLMMGWIMLVELRISGARITSGRLWKWTTIAVTLSLFLSSSKTGWMVMLVELFARILPFLRKGLRSVTRQSGEGRLIVQLPRGRTLVNFAVLSVVAVAASVYFVSKVDPWILLAGTGIGNTAAHSYVSRAGTAQLTLDAFFDHPFIGRSLGGVPVYLASRNGIEVRDMSQVRGYWGFPVILDVLVASGVIGFIPFLLFLYANTFGALRTATRFWPSERAKWLRALARAMIFECLMLSADQNLMRVYLWFHLSMVALVAYNVEFESASGLAAAPLESSAGPLLEAIPNT